MLGSIVKLIEQGKIPDIAVRAGIRKLCRQRLEEEHYRDLEAQSEQYNRFLEEVRNSALAIDTYKANEQHYEVPAAFFVEALGTHLKYSSGYWPQGVTTLDEAEQRMLALYLERGQLENGQSILELGCGWGSLTLYMASQLPDSEITAISNSHSQREYIMGQAEQRGLSNIQIITCDINAFEPDGQFDRVVSIEMFEHVRNYQRLFDQIASWLKPGGKLFVHVFCHRFLMYPFIAEGEDNWMARHFFSGGQMPSADTFLQFQQRLTVDSRWLVDGRHYEKTSNAWLANMDAAREKIMPVFQQTYGDDAEIWWQRWRIFFMSCAELFGMDQGTQWHVVHYLFSPNGR